MTAHVKANLKGEHALRRRLEARIEEAIRLLDHIDGDPDLEDADFEPDEDIGIDDEPHDEEHTL